MTTVIHKGKNPPTLDAWSDPDNTERVWFVWPTDKTIATSSWILPTGMTGSAELVAQSVVDNGTTYTNANSVLVDFGSVTDGRYQITNRVTFSPEGAMDRSCYVIVKNT